MSLSHFLFSHEGRIGRRAYWIYTAIAVAILAAGIVVVNPTYAKHFAYLNGPQLVMSIAFALIGLGVSVKRVNDFGGPRWLGWFVPMLSIGYDISDYLRLFGDITRQGVGQTIFYLIGMTILAGVIYVGVRGPRG
jgi:uncharacterized membrane protein YhaH (DUF805 family)